MSTKFAIAINKHGTAYYLNPHHIRRMVERGKGAERETAIETTDDQSIVVRTPADDIARQARGSDFIEVTARPGGIRIINCSQIFAVDPPVDGDDGCTVSLLSGEKIEVEDSYDHMCDLLGVDAP